MHEFFRVWATVVGDNLAGTNKFPFVNHQSFQPDRPAGVDFARADTHLGPQAVAVAVAESRAALSQKISPIIAL
jgi:hypothetical protein